MTVTSHDTGPGAGPGAGKARSSLLYDPKVRALFFQGLVLVSVVVIGWIIIQNTVTNMAAAGLASGFGFLETTAGFGVTWTLIPYSEESSYGYAFVVALLNTLLVSAIGIVLTTLLGFFIGIMRLSKNWLVARMAWVYIETLRNIPLLLQIFFWYFAVLRNLPSPRDSFVIPFGLGVINIRGLYLPSPTMEPGFSLIPIGFVLGLIGAYGLRRWSKRRQARTGQQFPDVLAGLGLIIGLPVLAALAAGVPFTWSYPELRGFNFVGGFSVIPEFVALLLALTLYTAAFIAEIVRAGIQAVSHGQTEAAHSLGLSHSKTLRLVVVPQALRVIVPPLISQYLNLFKNSSLAAAIAYPELMLIFGGVVLNQTGQAIEVLAIVMAVYLTISLLISLVMNIYNRSIMLVER
ncbi:MAG: amino acid ABC transporter permease [Alphaproteobacteria bacterium]